MEVPKCIDGNRAVNICISDDCEYPNPFICAGCLNNQCKQMHRHCINPEWENIKNRIEHSKKLNHPDFIKLSSAVEQIIHKAITYLNNQFQQFNLWKSTFGMPTDAINLFQSIQNNQEHRFTGKQVAQILKDAKIDKEIKKFNEANIKYQIKEVLKKMQQVQKSIREMYSVWDIPQVKVSKITEVTVRKVSLSLKIKEKYIDNLNKRLINLSEKPTNLELKFVIFNKLIRGQLIRVQFNIISGFPQFALSFQNPNLISLKALTLYIPYNLGLNSDFIYYEQLISSSLLSLPELQSFTIILHDIKSLDGFKGFGTKLNISKDEGWYLRQKW